MHRPVPPEHNTRMIRPPEDFFLPAGYIQQEVAHTRDEGLGQGLGDGEYWNEERIKNSGGYQHHVYRWAAHLISEYRLMSCLDVGCGPGTKLREHIHPVCKDIVGLDQPAGVEVAKRLGVPGEFIEVDLETPELIETRTFDLIICADVIEHLLDPDPMLELIKRHCDDRSLVLLSTPDRARLHGRACMASTKPEHVREWTGPEFDEYLTDRGFEVVDHRFFPADDAPIHIGADQEARFVEGNSETSPHRCQTLLCRPKIADVDSSRTHHE